MLSWSSVITCTLFIWQLTLVSPWMWTLSKGGIVILLVVLISPWIWWRSKRTSVGPALTFTWLEITEMRCALHQWLLAFDNFLVITTWLSVILGERPFLSSPIWSLKELDTLFKCPQPWHEKPWTWFPAPWFPFVGFWPLLLPLFWWVPFLLLLLGPLFAGPFSLFCYPSPFLWLPEELFFVCKVATR